MMWPSSDETQDLLQHAGQGDAEAVNRLMSRHRESLVRMVNARMNRGAERRFDASDIVQEVLIEANRRLAEYVRQPPMPFHAWLRQIAHDRLVDAYRRQLAAKRDMGREQALAAHDASASDGVGQLPDPEITPAAALLRRELETQFHAALERLGSDAREIILMRHSEQLSNSQVAELLGLSEAAAGMRYLRALRQLKGILGDHPSLWLG